jgi:hypothetical protein
MNLRVIVTGATGMVGEGVLIECLQHPDVAEVLIINRRPAGMEHPKLKEIIHADLSDLTPIKSQLKGYDGCFFCAGVTSLGKNEAEYTKLTYDLTLGFAKTLADQSPALTFCYVSGAGTDSTEQGSTMWARVKGKTENDLLKLPFKAVYNFRPGFMKATPGQKNLLSLYKYFAWLYPVLRKLFPKSACTLKEVGQAMINATISGYDKPIVEVLDIVELSRKTKIVSPLAV